MLIMLKKVAAQMSKSCRPNGRWVVLVYNPDIIHNLCKHVSLLQPCVMLYAIHARSFLFHNIFRRKKSAASSRCSTLQLTLEVYCPCCLHLYLDVSHVISSPELHSLFAV